ncbi:uncharacterized protein PG986_007996 [Apiospora aurea]|uniref:Uncharacterized protein n=1 Tax=Apiospora aurea TaxID=335848 RepID=A0ABR1QE69_9PEZI
MMSAGESRRTPSDMEASKRQSLPSISEVFSSSKPSPYSPTTPSTMGSAQGLPPPPPPPFSSAPPRSDVGPEPRAAVSGPEERFSRFAPRHEGHYSAPSSSGFAFGEQREGAKPSEPSQRNGSHPPGLSYSHSGHLPPGQYPLGQAPPISPRHMGPPGPPYEHHRPPLHSDEDYGLPRRYDTSALNRHFEAWGYTDCLQRISWTARTMSNFAEAYLNIASEQHGGQPIPERLPTSREITEMLSNVDYMRKSLENVREIQHNVETEKAREAGKHQRPYDDDDVSMYGDGLKQHYGIGEVKKRRGRHLQVDATAATGLIHQNGAAGRMEPGHSAMRVDYTTQSWKGNDRWNSEPSDRKPVLKIERKGHFQQASYPQQLWMALRTIFHHQRVYCTIAYASPYQMEMMRRLHKARYTETRL